MYINNIKYTYIHYLLGFLCWSPLGSYSQQWWNLDEHFTSKIAKSFNNPKNLKLINPIFFTYPNCFFLSKLAHKIMFLRHRATSSLNPNPLPVLPPSASSVKFLQGLSLMCQHKCLGITGSRLWDLTGEEKKHGMDGKSYIFSTDFWLF